MKASTKQYLQGIALKYDICAAKKKEPCAVREMPVALKFKELQGILRGNDQSDQGALKVLQRRCNLYNLKTTKMITKGLVEKWWGKPKGMKQLLLERGNIDLMNLGQYTKDGKADLNGNVIPGTSLKKLLENCEDFKNETSIMEFISEKRGVTMMSTPKYHCESKELSTHEGSSRVDIVASLSLRKRL
jgi:hypothetical protein